MKKFSEAWNGEDDIKFYADVATMVNSFRSWPLIQYTKDLEAKMPQKLVHKMKEEAAQEFRAAGFSEKYIKSRLRMPDGMDDVTPDDEEFIILEKDMSRRSRIEREVKARRRRAEIADLRRRCKMKAERDREILYFNKNGFELEIHDSKLWKPMNNKARTSSWETSL